MSNTPQLQLAHHLKALKLPTFLREYDKLAQQCAAEGVDHPRYLLRLAELEMIDRETGVSRCAVVLGIDSEAILPAMVTKEERARSCTARLSLAACSGTRIAIACHPPAQAVAVSVPPTIASAARRRASVRLSQPVPKVGKSGSGL